MRMHRPLTSGEIDLARTIFKDNIDYSKARIYERRIWGLAQDTNRAVAFKNHTSFPGNAYSEDFSKDQNAEKQSVFIHEMLHVFQHQNRTFNIKKEFSKAVINEMGIQLKNLFNGEKVQNPLNYAHAYLYTLENGKDFFEYGFEQQAAIVQDYFLLKHHGVTESYKERRKNGDVPQDVLLELYKNVLGSFLNTPTERYTAAPSIRNSLTPAPL